MEYLVGIDDTDSLRGMCTTFLAYSIACTSSCFTVLPYPKLVRLNPNIPFKTRGNAAICLKISTDDLNSAFGEICDIVSRYSDTENGANPGVVVVREDEASAFTSIYMKALSGVVNYKRLEKTLNEKEVRFFTLGNGMGIVGACASIGFPVNEDHTYELIAYRRKENIGRKRAIKHESVIKMDRLTFPDTFNNYDYESKRILITPHGPDPVLLGIRGNNPGVLLRAYEALELEEDPLGYMIYLTNQHTDAHLTKEVNKTYSSGWIEGKISSIKTIQGGHVQIELEPSKPQLMVYEPTGDLVRVSRLLMEGDVIRAYGGVRRKSSKHGPVLNVEKIEVISVNRTREINPVCKRCNTSMESMGRNKGYVCRRCNAIKRKRQIIKIKRDLVEGTYLPSPRAHRHLTKPFQRYVSSSTTDLKVKEWVKVYELPITSRGLPLPQLGSANL